MSLNTLPMTRPTVVPAATVLGHASYSAHLPQQFVLGADSLYLLQIHIITPVPSVAMLALSRWLQDTHHTVQGDSPAFLRQKVLLVVKHWIAVTPPQSPAGQQGSDSTPGPSSISPGASSSGPGAAASSPAESNITPGATASSSAAGAASPGAAASSSGAAAITPGLAVSTASRQRRSSSGGKQKQTASSSLPAVAVKVFGPEYSDARNQDAIVSMVTGSQMPFRCAIWATVMRQHSTICGPSCTVFHVSEQILYFLSAFDTCGSLWIQTAAPCACATTKHVVGRHVVSDTRPQLAPGSNPA